MQTNDVLVYTQPLYDTMQLPIAAVGQMVSFFTIPFGGPLTAAINKGYQHTNLVQAGRLEKGIKLKIQALSFALKGEVFAGVHPTWADYTAVMENSAIELLIGQRSYLHLPTTLTPPGPGETNYFSNIAAAATEFRPGHGLGSVNNIFKFEEPLFLNDQESIRVDLDVHVAVVAAVDVQLVLWGTMQRPAG